MKALTLTQPWAQLVAHGLKRVETRDWPCPQWLVGQWLAIHAGKTFGGLAGTGYPATSNGLRAICHVEPYHSALAENGHLASAQIGLTDAVAPIDMLTIPLGAVVAIVRVSGCVATEKARPQLEQAGADDSRWIRELLFGNFDPERYAWKFTDLRPLKPIPCPGERKLWDLPSAVEHEIARQLAG